MKVQLVQEPPNAESTDDEKDEEEQEDPEVDDAEILENLPDDTEVCTCIGISGVYEKPDHS